MSTDVTTHPEVEQVPLVALSPALWNPRTIKDERFRNLCRSLEADPGFLQVRPILATADGTIFVGNMRYPSAQHLGWAAILVDIPEALAKERALRDNAQWGELVKQTSRPSLTSSKSPVATSTSSASMSATSRSSSTRSPTLVG